MLLPKNYCCKISLLIIVVAVCFQPVTAQGEKPKDSGIDRAKEVLDRARLAIYGTNTSTKIDSIRLVKSGTSYAKTTSEFESKKGNGKAPKSISAVNRGRVKEIIAISRPNLGRTELQISTDDATLKQNSKVDFTLIVNGEKYFQDADAYVNGQLINIDKLNSFLDNLKAKIRNTKGVNLNKTAVSADAIYKSLWRDFFPFLLYENETSPDFRYVGVAKSNGKTADVLEVLLDNGRVAKTQITERYFFEKKQAG